MSKTDRLIAYTNHLADLYAPGAPVITVFIDEDSFTVCNCAVCVDFMRDKIHERLGRVIEARSVRSQARRPR